MPYSHYDRLTAVDAAFLEIEDGNAHMHIGSVATFDPGPLAREGGGLDFEQVVKGIEATLSHNARFRQKLAYVPGMGHPVWVDDERFNIHYHLRHTCLPAPGDVRLLKRLAGRILSQELDRGKPLWETWYVDGLEGGKFAIINKIHHCLADGISGVDLTTAMMGTDPDWRPKGSTKWIPRAAPTGTRLFVDELQKRALTPLSAVGAAGRAIVDSGNPITAARGFIDGMRRQLGGSISSASETPFNADLGPHRRFDWARTEMSAIQEIREARGGKLNDVVLTVVTGAVRRFLRSRGLRTEDMDFRVMVPVSLRSESERGSLGNRVYQMTVKLPVPEPDRMKQLEQVCEATAEMRENAQSVGSATLDAVADTFGAGFLTTLARLGLQARAANVVTTNVPGPPMPVYMLGARMLEAYPVVPLGPSQTLGIALLSYAGTLHWGLNADWDAMPDLHDFAVAIEEEFEALHKSAVG